MAKLTFDRSFDPRHGEAVILSPLVSRVTAANAGPFTFHGTNTYLVGQDTVAVVDPGPREPDHMAAVLSAIGGRRVSHVLVTHTHVDHSSMAPDLARRTGAQLVGCGPHRAARSMVEGEVNPLDASSDAAYRPDHELNNGDHISGVGWNLEAVATPGHTINHLSFFLVEENALIAGDHVMAWSTSVIAPPDGQMRAYMDSLKRTASLDCAICWPGHGGPIREPGNFHDGLIRHREAREAAVLDALSAGPATIQGLVPIIYATLDPKLFGAAALSMFAHLEDLADRGLVTADPHPHRDAVWREGAPS